MAKKSLSTKICWWTILIIFLMAMSAYGFYKGVGILPASGEQVYETDADYTSEELNIVIDGTSTTTEYTIHHEWEGVQNSATVQWNGCNRCIHKCGSDQSCKIYCYNYLCQ